MASPATSGPDNTVRKFMLQCTDPHHYWGASLGRGIENAVYGMTCVHDTVATEITPKIVCLCGSTRFYEEFQRWNYERTMRGNIVLSVGFYPHAQDEVHGEDKHVTPEQKVALDELHKRKIDLADEVFVINVGGYIGESTRSEIDYALAQRKVVNYLEAV